MLTEVNGATSCERTEAEYPHPVVQVKLGKINITKQWSDDNSKHANDSVTVQLKRKAIGATTDAEDVGNPITLDASNQWTTTVGNLLPGYTYSVVETSVDDRYDVSYTDNADLTKQMVWSSEADGTLNATITNTLKTATLKNAIGVKKELVGRDWKDSDEFVFTLKAKGNAPMPSDCKDKPSCTVTVKHDSTGHTESFGDITYNAGAATYTYYVTENSGNYHCTALLAGEVQSRSDREPKTMPATWRCCRDVRDQDTGRQRRRRFPHSQGRLILRSVTFTNRLHCSVGAAVDGRNDGSSVAVRWRCGRRTCGAAYRRCRNLE